jgi:hypothetical protein
MFTRTQAQAFAHAFHDDLKVNFVSAKLPDIPVLKNERGEHRGCDMTELLSLQLNSVKNLYSYDEANQDFHLTYRDKTIAGFANCIVKPRRASRLNVHYEDRTFIEDGINFLGKIIVAHRRGETFYIRLMGERSYDPSGSTGAVNSEFIDPDFFSIYLGITIAEVRACMLGGDSAFVDSCQSVIRPINEKYYRRGLVHEWMGEQIKAAFFDKVQAENFPQYLLRHVGSGLFKLEKGRNEHTMEFLEGVMRKDRGEKHETVIPRQFYSAIKESHSINLSSSDMNEDEYQKLTSYSSKKVNPQAIALKLLPELISGKSANKISLQELRRRCDILWSSYATKVNQANERLREHKARIATELPQNKNCSIF